MTDSKSNLPSTCNGMSNQCWS